MIFHISTGYICKSLIHVEGTRITRSVCKLVSISTAKASRTPSSSTLNVRKRRPPEHGRFWLGCSFFDVSVVAEAIAVVASFQNVATMGQAVEQCGGHLGIAEHGRPFSKAQIGGDGDAGVLVELADEMGPDLKALFVTSASVLKDRGDRLAGSLWAIETSVAAAS